jgi:membrane protease YdiL (CAAX protease family)
MSVFAFVYYGVMLIIGLLILVDYVRNREQSNVHLKHYLKCGLFMGILTVCPTLLLVLILGIASGHIINLSGLYIIGFLLVKYLFVLGLTCIGMYYSRKVGYDGLPVIRNYLHRTRDFREIVTGEYWFQTLCVGFGSILLSFLVLELSGYGNLVYSTDESSLMLSIMLTVFVLLDLQNILLEEIVYRLCIQNYLTDLIGTQGYRHWIPICFTSLIWTFAHFEAISFFWPILIQRFLIGMAYGFLSKRNGIESSIIAHMMTNLLITIVYGCSVM